MWKSDGTLISDFGSDSLCTKSASISYENLLVPQDYVVSVSQSKKYLFSFMTETVESTNSGGNVGQAFINVIDIQRERVIAKVRIDTADDPLSSISRAVITDEGSRVK